MKNSMLMSLLVAGLLAGCASSGPPMAPEQLTEAEVALQSAERAGAEEYAPELMAKSRQALAAASRASSRGEGDAARQRVLEARDYAAAAEAKAKAENLKSQAARLRGEADDLEARADEIRDETRPPS
jgi:hypothetical protein